MCFLTSQSEKLCGPKHWKTLGLFCIVVVMGGQGASQFSPLQVSLVKGRLGTFPNYSALYLKKKLWWNGFFTAVGVFAEQELKSNVLRDHKSSFWDEPIKQLNIYRWNREYSLYFQCPINKIVPKAGISQKEGIEFCNRWISWSGKR